MSISSIRTGFRPRAFAGIFMLVLPLLVTAADEPKKMRSEGADLVFGGVGTGPGKFTALLDMTFDPAGNLYTLEGGGTVKFGKTTTFTGLGRVQKFDAQGKYLSEFPLGDDIPADVKDWPTRLAVIADGSVYVAFPVKGFVRQYGPDGKKVRDDALPGATAVAFDAAKGRVAASARYPFTVKNPLPVPTKGQPPAKQPAPPPAVAPAKTPPVAAPENPQILLLDPAGGAPQAVTLSQAFHNVNDMTIDKDGNFYFQGGDKHIQIAVYDATGKFIKTIGSGMLARNEDGSEPLDTVAVDSHGNIYNTGRGNPLALTMYTADGKTVVQHRGQFKYGDPWNGNSLSQNSTCGALVAVAPDDRVWVGAMALHDPASINFPRYVDSPVILRTEPKFFDPNVFGATHQSTTKLGFIASLQTDLPFNVSQTLGPIQDTFVVGPANRHVQSIDVDYHVYDYFKNEIAKGTLKVPLQDGVEARVPFSFTPPRWGWYMVEANVMGNGENLGGVSQQIGVTPVYADLPVKPEEFLNGWDDIPRQVFCGLLNVRLSPSKGLDSLDTDVANAQKYGTTFSIQLTDVKADLTPEKLRPIIERYKGRVPYYEIFNEPNFSFSGKDFAEKAKPVYQMIKEVDPQAKVLGPSTCGILLPWIDQYFQNGGTEANDIIAVHDYEGHESIIPEHWRYKLAALHAMMDKYGQGQKEVWQTERAISGVRAGSLISDTQAVRTALQRNLMVTLGVASDHNSHYYLNQGGYAAVPSYAWDTTGPHAAALTLRTREAFTHGRKYTSQIDFGPTGNKMLLGLRYEGGDGPIIIVQNLGTADLPIDLGVKSGDALEVIDSFGNVQSVAVKDGKATVPIPQLPVYLHLKPDQDVTFPQFDFGKNIAPAAQITYSGQARGDVSLIQDGILETYQGGDPNGDTNGLKIWKGELLTSDQPQTLDFRWKSPRTFESVIIFSTHADNGFCALLDYDLQAWQDGAWKTISQVRTKIPTSDAINGCSDVTGVSWIEDNNFTVAHFAPVTTDQLRVLLIRATYGVNPDDVANQVQAAKIGGANNAAAMLREIEVYSPKGPIQLSSHADQPAKSAIFASDTVTTTVSNNGAQPFQGNIVATAPEGWTISPEKAPVNVAAGAKADVVFTVKPPADLPTGNALFNFEARDEKDASVDFDVFSFVITAPFMFHQDVLPISKGNSQTFGLGISNQTTEPLSGTARLEITGPTKIDPIEQPFGPVDPGKWNNPKFDVPIDLTKGSWTATYTVTVNHLTSKLVVNMAQRQWSVIGAFENDFDKVFGPESDIANNKVDVAQTYTDTFGGEQKWQVVSDDAAGKVNLLDRFSTSQNATAYAAVWVDSPKAQPAYLSGALNRAGKIWLNGKVVASRENGRGVVWGQEHAMVNLVEGKNLVLIKVVADGQKQWAFLFDLLDPATHKPLAGLNYSPTP